MLNCSKIKAFNLCQSLSLRLLHRPLLCYIDHTNELFICQQCHRILCDCHLNDMVIQTEDVNLCMDCWESKYREELLNLDDSLKQAWLDSVKKFFD